MEVRSLHQVDGYSRRDRGYSRLDKGRDRGILWCDWAMKRAVQHALLIIAEAAKHIPDDLKETRPEVPWKSIHGLANLLRHEYRRIDSDILWSIITENLADLDRAAEILLAGEPE
jgi:uncharacterized protein with HEPN domain